MNIECNNSARVIRKRSFFDKAMMFYLYILLFALSTTLVFLMGEDQRNYMLIGLMGVTPAVLLLFVRFFKVHDLLPLSMIVFMSYTSYFLHDDTFRSSTLMYSWMFVLTFLSVNLMLRAELIGIYEFRKFLGMMIFVYAGCLVLQQISVIAGVPVFNSMNVNDFKLSALASEPSHTARFMTILMYAYTACEEILRRSKGRISLSEFCSSRKNLAILLAFIYVMVTCLSTTAILFCLLYFLYFVNMRTLLFLVFLGFMAIRVGLAYKHEGVTRAVEFFPYLISEDVDGMILVDHSASLRFIHVFLLWNKADFGALYFWFGGGHGTAGDFFYDLIPGVEKGTSTGGLFTSTVLDYGLITIILLLLTVICFCLRKRHFFDIMIFMTVCFFSGFNGQIFWQALIFLAAIKLFATSPDGIALCGSVKRNDKE